LAVGEVATRDYLRRELEEIHDLLQRLQPPTESDKRDGGGKSEPNERRSKKQG
jgi:hypothetical protein